MAPGGSKGRLLAGQPSFIDRAGWRVVSVSGPDAAPWLDGLVSADLSGLQPGRALRSLLLSPTGRIRAEFMVASVPGGFALLQDPEQPSAIDRLLGPYVLSSDVELVDRTVEVCVFSCFGIRRRAVPAASVWAPTWLGAGFEALVPDAGRREALRRLEALGRGLGEREAEGVRILRGIPRWGREIEPEDLPQEAGLDSAVGLNKGCYLGQESVARVRNLGHPRRLVLRLVAGGPVSPGEPILARGNEAGRVTSAASDGDRWNLLGRVAWRSRRGPFATAGGLDLHRRG